jgi:hypothetical protein
MMHGVNPGRVLFGVLAVAVPAAFVLFGLVVAIRQVLRKILEDWRARSRARRPQPGKINRNF